MFSSMEANIGSKHEQQWKKSHLEFTLFFSHLESASVDWCSSCRGNHSKVHPASTGHMTLCMKEILRGCSVPSTTPCPSPSTLHFQSISPPRFPFKYTKGEIMKPHFLIYFNISQSRDWRHSNFLPKFHFWQLQPFPSGYWVKAWLGDT